ncbi:MAG: hypothetical protein AAF368_18825, partial [Planctomycetota bacterium]
RFFERTFGLPCGAASNLTRDYATYRGCDTGRLLGTAAPAASPTPSPTPSPTATGNGAQTQQEDQSKSSKKTSSSGASLGVLLGVAAAIVGLGVCLSAALCFYAETLKQRNRDVAALAAVEKSTELPPKA